jgi:hypothetical protein
MKIDEINKFEKVTTQLNSLYEELSALSKKSQNDALNKFKLKFVNLALQEANNLLGAKYKPFGDFEKFDDEDLPTNSDVTMMLGQYLSCIEKLRADNIQMRHGNWYWLANGKESDIRTSRPNKIKE